MGYFKKVIKGGIWIGMLRVVIRGFGYIKIGILARLLTPSQFGIFGIASLVLAFLEILTQTGINVFLIQEKNLQKYLNTAWVISIIRGVLISIVILVSASFISNFFNSPSTYKLIVLISIVPFLRGFINPAEIKFRKEVEFHKEFYFRSFLFFVDTISTLIIAYISLAASSFIYGMIIGVIFEVVISCIFIKPRPKLSFNFSLAKKIVGRGKWVTMSGIFNYFAHQGDDIVVGKLLNPAFLGIYQNAFKISTLPLTEVAQVASQVTFPIYSKISNDLSRLKRVFKKVFTTNLLVIIPFGMIFYLFPQKMILIILGEKWLEAAEALRVLALYGIIKSLINVTESLFFASKLQNVVALISFVEFVSMAIVIIPLVLKYDIVGAGYASIISVVVVIPLVFYYLTKYFKHQGI